MRKGYGLIAAAAALMVALLVATGVSATTYEYDALGRVIKVIYDDGSVIEYEYDEAGNRTIVEQDGN